VSAVTSMTYARLSWFLGTVSAAVSATTLFTVDGISPLIPLLSLLAMLGVSIAPSPILLRLRPLTKITPTLMVLALIAIDFVLSDTINALLRASLGLLLIRTLAPRESRHQWQLLLRGLMLISLCGALSLSLEFGLLATLFGLLSIPTLLFTTLAADEKSIHAPWKDFRWVTFPAQCRQALGREFLFIGLLSALVIPTAATLLFLLFPRIDLNQNLPLGQLGQGKSLSGFSEEVKIGEVTEITKDNSIALRVDPPRPLPQKLDPYWRMLVLNHYSNGTFRMGDQLSEKLRSGTRRREIPFPAFPDNSLRLPKASLGVWNFYLESNVSRFLPLLGEFANLRLESPKDIVTSSELRIIGTGQTPFRVLSYQLFHPENSPTLPDSRHPEEGLPLTWIMLNQPWRWNELPPEITATRELELSDTDIALLQDWTAPFSEASPEPLDFAREVESWLKNSRSYSLESRIPEGQASDPLLRWLFSEQPGHCELFAGSMILMCRAAGIPARMVVGFSGAEWNRFEGYLLVRNSNAHAWVEVFDGQNQWVRFDPTPGDNMSLPLAQLAQLSEENRQENTALRWRLWLDSWKMAWYRRVIDFNSEEQQSLAQESLETGKNWAETISQKLRELAKKWKEQTLQLAQKAKGLPIEQWALLFLAIITAALALKVLQNNLRKRLLKFSSFRKNLEKKQRRHGSYWLHKKTSQLPPEAHRSIQSIAQTLRFGPPLSPTQLQQYRLQLQQLWKNAKHFVC